MSSLELSGLSLGAGLPGLSRFGFGTASLHHVSSDAARRRLLDSALANGITHFDTAPAYGFGLAERALAAFLAAEPTVTVASKVGLYPPGGADQSAWSMLLRKVTGKIRPSASRFIADWSVARAQQSLDGSLRRLGRERLDLLLLHEPDAAVIDTDEWLIWLDQERARGRVLSFGVAGAIGSVLPFVTQSSPLARVVQTRDSINQREAQPLLNAGHPLQITYGYLAAAKDGPMAVKPKNILIEALKRNPEGTILVSTRHPERLRACAEALLASTDERGIEIP